MSGHEQHTTGPPRVVGLFVVRDAVCSANSRWTASERLVALAVGDHLNKAGKCWPSQRRLAAWTGLSKRTVRATLHRLCGPEGIFDRDLGGPKRGNRYAPSVYTLRAAAAASLREEESSSLGGARGAIDVTREGKELPSREAAVAGKRQETKEHSRITDQRTTRGLTPPDPASSTQPVQKDNDRDWSLKSPSRSSSPSREPRKGAGEEAQRIAEVYTKVFNATFQRRVSATPMVTRRIEARLREGYAEWQLIAQPVLVFANTDDKAFLKAVQPEWPLRDGKHPRTQDGQTTGAVDWLERELQRLDRTRFSARLVNIAMEYGVIDILKAHGVTEKAPEERW